MSNKISSKTKTTKLAVVDKDSNVRKFTVEQLNSIAYSASILRACPDVPFSLANRINLCKINADNIINNVYKPAVALLDERYTDAKKLADNDANQLAEAKLEYESNLIQLYDQLHEVDMGDLKNSEFENLDIKGEKVVEQADSSIKTFSYREAYFELVGSIIN